VSSVCERCRSLEVELVSVRERADLAEEAAERAQVQLREALKLIDLQRADLERYRVAYERIQPNTPERVPTNQLQLAFERVLLALQDCSAAEAANQAPRPSPSQDEEEKGKRGAAHGRRRLDLTNLPVERVEIDPEEVVAVGGEGFVRIGEEVSERVAFKPGGYIRLRIVRGKFARVEDVQVPIVETELEPAAVVSAPLPESVWPKVMADPSAIAQVAISKYDDSLPLNRQERISTRQGFTIPRSTQCGWLGAAYLALYRIVEAMLVEAKAKAFCIATDATGAPVRAEGKCERWHIFVLLADRDHIVFRYTPEHTSAFVEKLFEGFRGHLLADAAPIYDVLYRGSIIEIACWFHLRRYFWRVLPSDPSRGLEALAIISRLFQVERATREMTLPEKTAERARMASPILDLFDEWVTRNRDHVEARGPLEKALTYYDNQREALRQFLTDGRIRLDNGISEQQLRNVALGRHNWTFFENETGLKWYTTFRSLIASCSLHDLNAQLYVEQVLRLAPHWPTTRVIELAPKYWKATVANLDARHRAILERPWEAAWPSTKSTAPPQSAAA
jgi:transposase